MTQFSHEQYDILEHAVSRGTRVAIQRRNGREYVVIPLALRSENSREVVEARNPTTGHALRLYVDEIEAIHALP
jgi:hypothetical protein